MHTDINCDSLRTFINFQNNWEYFIYTSDVSLLHDQYFVIRIFQQEIILFIAEFLFGFVYS